MRVLPGPLRTPIGLAYLLARAADTIADTRLISPRQRTQRLVEFKSQVNGSYSENVLDEITSEIAESKASITETVLVRSLSSIFVELEKTNEADRSRIRSVVTRLIDGMEMDLSVFHSEEPGELIAFPDAESLDRYTYLVAGCVGPFWTETLVAHTGSLAQWDVSKMSDMGVKFGKALQITNVLRDVPHDLRSGRCYLPLDHLTSLGLSAGDLLNPTTSLMAKPVLRHWIEIALEYFTEAEEYLLLIPDSERRLRLACLWPVLMGLQTLSILAKRRWWLSPENPAKASRKWVYWMLARSTAISSSEILISRWIKGLKHSISTSL